MNRNLLIVDDEREILEWLEELFRYDFDLEVSVYTANSAREAIAQLNSVRCDVVLTDIKMPGMDGIALFEHIKANWPRCKTVFLTGYKNFDDVYRIVNHQDVQYILKNEGDEVILQAVRQAFLALEQEAEQAQREQDAARQLQKARFWMRKELMDQLLTGLMPTALQQDMRMLEFELDGSLPVLVHLLRIDASWRGSRDESILHMENLIGAIRKNSPAKLQLYIHMIDRQYALLLSQDGSAEQPDWHKTATVVGGMLEYAQEDFKAACKNTFSAVAYPDPIPFGELSDILPTLRMVMNRYVGSAHEVICTEIPEAQDTHKEGSQNTAARISALLNLLELRKKEDYFELLGNCLCEMALREDRHDPRALEIYYSIAVRILHFINENHLNEQIAGKIGMYELTNADAHASWTQAGQYLTEVSRCIFDMLGDNETNSTHYLLNRVISYINDHLDEDLTLTRLAAVGGFNASYLSRIFKQMTGTGLNAFITHKRMELAKKLLAQTNIKVQDIAAQTGYLSAHSFTRTFRSEVGVSPTDWRASKIGKK